MKIEEKMSELMKYRNLLSQTDQEVFDMLMDCAKKELQLHIPNASANI